MNLTTFRLVDKFSEMTTLNKRNLSSLNYILTTASSFQLADHLSLNQTFQLQSDQPIALPNVTGNFTSSWFEALTNYYSQVHGWLSLFVCLFGIIANLVNILVLTR